MSTHFVAALPYISLRDVSARKCPVKPARENHFTGNFYYMIRRANFCIVILSP